MRPQPLVLLHNDVTRMLEHTTAGLRSSILRRGFEPREDLRAAVVAAGPPCGYVFECLGKAILLAAHFVAHGALLSGRELADLATQRDGGYPGHQLSALFGVLQGDHPDCVGELNTVLSEPFTNVAASVVDAFVARLRYLWQDEARGVRKPLDFDKLTMDLQSTYLATRGGESARRPASTGDALAGLDSFLSGFADSLIEIYFALTAGLWHATQPLPYFPSATLLGNAAKAFPARAERLLGVTLADAPPGWRVRALDGGGRWGHFGSEATVGGGES